jgi:Mg-chelatase subunit ChlD
MAALVSALDNYTPQQIGEKGHVEYGWSNNVQDKILQLSFQATRGNEDRIKTLRVVLSMVLITLKHQLQNGSLPEKQVAKGYLSILYKMIGQTRDIVDGKGEYTLAYMMIHTWYDFFPELALFALKCLVDLGDKKVHQYGSWKDIKYFCEFCKTHGSTIDHPLIQESIRLTNEQLRKDSLTDDLTLVAKWVPREKSSFGWLYEALATDYYKEYMATADSKERIKKATLKCKTEYRKLLSTLNKKLDTLQIKQCANTWSEIEFKNVTSVSLGKQKKAFLNINKKGDVRYPDRDDRLLCAQIFNLHVQKAVKGEIEMKGKRIGMADFTKQARQLKYCSGKNVEKDLLNSQWRDNSSQNGALDNFVPVVDTSGSMIGDPMDVAIALGIRIAEKSKLGKRVMTFSMKPSWINLEPYDDFVSQVKVIESSEVGYNTNFHAVLNLFLDTIIENKMDPDDVQNMVIVLLSDMQIDEAEPKDYSLAFRVHGAQKREALYESIKSKYAEAGMRVHGKPYKPPHMLFWNLRGTSGFPCLSNEKNVSMMSGFSPALLNSFCEHGISSLQSCTPWSILEESLNSERYKIMGDYLEIHFHL